MYQERPFSKIKTCLLCCENNPSEKEKLVIQKKREELLA